MRRRVASREELLELKKYDVPAEKTIFPAFIEYEPGEMICHDTVCTHELIFLLEGRAKIFIPSESGENLILALFDGFGIIDDLELFLNDGIYHSSCQALTPVAVIALPLAENRGILMSSNEFLRAASLLFAKSLQRNRNHFNNILYPLSSRLCSYIAATESNGLWEDNLSRVSEILGVSYRHLLRSLQTLCDSGVLQKAACGYKIINQDLIAKQDKGFFPIVE